MWRTMKPLRCRYARLKHLPTATADRVLMRSNYLQVGPVRANNKNTAQRLVSCVRHCAEKTAEISNNCTPCCQCFRKPCTVVALFSLWRSYHLVWRETSALGICTPSECTEWGHEYMCMQRSCAVHPGKCTR